MTNKEERDTLLALMNAFMLRAKFWYDLGEIDRYRGIWECIDHIADYIKYHLGDADV